MRQPRMVWGLVAVAAVLATSIVSGSAAVAVDDYPSWSDVEAAKVSVAATEAETVRIGALLDQLQARTAHLGDEAVRKGFEYEQAQDNFHQAAAQATVREGQADTASTRASTSSRRAGTLAAQLYRSGNIGFELMAFLDGTHADKLLYRLGAMSKLTEQASRLSDEADSERNSAQALTAQADLVKTERDRLQIEAQRSLATAQAAQQAADQEVAAQKVASDTLYAQLASLKNTSADVEQRYRNGVIAQQQYEEQQRQAEANSEKSGGGGFMPPGGVVVNPAGAQDYAAGQVANRGWGGGEFNCLVLLWNRESGWRLNAYNASSGAYGIPQSLPGSKMQSAGDDWQTNAATQINWGLGYIADRYGSPCGAWAHSEATNWY